MSAAESARAGARGVPTRAYVVLTVLQFLPLGLHVPVEILLMHARGLTAADIGLVIGIAALTTAVLELPTGGLADTLGRRGVLLAGGVLTLVSFLMFAVAPGLPGFIAAGMVFATGRALQSGPLKSWYVDAVRDSVAQADRDEVLTRGLGLGGTATGLGVAVGALVGGVLADAATVAGLSAEGDEFVVALSVPFLLGAVLLIGYVWGLYRLLREPPKPHQPLTVVLAQVPATIAGGLRLLGRDRVLWCFATRWALVPVGFLAYDLLTPVRLEDLLADPSRAASVLGVLVAVCYAGEGVAAPLAPWLRRHVGPLRGAGIVTSLAGVAFAVAGLGSLPVLVGAVVAAFVVMGPSNALVGPVLHARVDSRQRTTLLSVQSLIQQGAIALGAVGLGALLSASGAPVAFGVAGVLTALAAVPLLGVAHWGGRHREVHADPGRSAPG